MKLCILAVGHKLPEWVAKGCAEYLKRMPRELPTSVVEIKPEMRGSKTREQLLAAENVRLQAALQGYRRIVVLDERGALKAAAAEDGTSLNRADIALGKARGALGMGVGSRGLEKMAKDRPHFIAAASHALPALIPVAGGVLIRDAKGQIAGVVGVSGDTSDNDEKAAAAGIAAAGYTADGGQG